MQSHAGGIQGQGLIRNDAHIMPALLGGIVHHKHMVGIDLAETKLIFVLGLFLKHRSFLNSHFISPQ